MKRFYAAFAVALALTAVLVAGLVRHFGSDADGPRLWDSGAAVTYSQEYGLVFNEAMGGQDHIPTALLRQDELAETLNPDHPDSLAVHKLLDLHRAILQDQAQHPGGPSSSLTSAIGIGGGERLRSAVAQGVSASEAGIAESTRLAIEAEGRAATGIGFAPGAAGVRDYWLLRLQEWRDVEAQEREAAAPYSSFFEGPAAVSVEQAVQAGSQAPRLESYRLYSVPVRIAEGWPSAPADIVGYILSTATALGQKAQLVVGVTQDGSLAYCAVVGGIRHCPSPLVEEVMVADRPRPLLGVLSASVLDADGAPDGGRIGLFNPTSSPTGHLEIFVASLNGSWNATASLGPVPAGGARFAFFDVLHDGPARVEVREGEAVLLAWTGEAVEGLGLVLA